MGLVDLDGTPLDDDSAAGSGSPGPGPFDNLVYIDFDGERLDEEADEARHCAAVPVLQQHGPVGVGCELPLYASQALVGEEVGYAYLGREAQRPPGQRHVKGFVPVEGNIKTDYLPDLEGSWESDAASAASESAWVR